MAELILTKAEKEAPTYLDWSDQALGKLVRKTALMLEDEYGQDATYTTTVAHILIGFGLKANSTETTITLEGVTEAGKNKGDWQVTVKQIKEP
jgi:hypothetical protein